MKIKQVEIVLAGPSADNSDLMTTIVDTVRQGSSRILANGKVLWVGMGNRTGLNSLLTRIKSNLHPGMEVQVQTFKTVHDHGQWITKHTAVIQ
jgi:hypothetical protein